MTRETGEEGFSLVETLVGLSMLSAVLITTYGVLSSSLAIAFRIAERSEAVDQVLKQFDELRQHPLTIAEEFNGETAGYRWSLSSRGYGGDKLRMIVPFHVVGRIARKVAGAPADVVFDTVLLGVQP